MWKSARVKINWQTSSLRHYQNYWLRTIIASWLLGVKSVGIVKIYRRLKNWKEETEDYSTEREEKWREKWEGEYKFEFM